MVEATDFANRDDLAEFRPLNWAAVGRILVEREVSTGLVVVREVAGEGAAQVRCAEDEDVIQTLAPGGADEPLREGILPGAVSRREDFTYAHALHALAERVAVDGVAIAEKKGRGRIVRERVDDLLGRPGSSGILGDVEVEDAPAIMCEHDKGEQDPQPHSGNDEEINGDQVADVISQERAPGLRGRCAALREEPGDGAFGHVDAEFQELTMDSRGTPEGIGRGHLYDKSRDLGVDPRAARVGRLESLVQCSRKRRRCHLSTVSGVTITRDCLHPTQTLASHTQKRPSLRRSLGPRANLLYTASCWRKARFSRASCRRPSHRSGRSRSR